MSPNAGLGLGVDAISGAINEYPEIVYVHMARAKDDFISFLTVGGAARWVGQGVRDACGVPWSADLRLNAGVVSGSVWRGQVEYIVGGRPDPKGPSEQRPGDPQQHVVRASRAALHPGQLLLQRRRGERQLRDR